MTLKYSATFEFDSKPPVTAQGRITASTMPTCFARAARQAQGQHKGLQWSSMVIVVERAAQEGQRES